MSRGQTRETTAADAVERARSLVGAAIDRPGDYGPLPIRYRLSKNSGGKDPHADHCASWSADWNLWTSDCVGLVSWALGFDRFQEHNFSEYGGWINTDSMIMESRRKAIWFEEIDTPELGCLVSTPSDFDRFTRKRRRAGHVGIVVDPLPAEWDGNWGDLRVIHCSSSASKRYKAAIRETSGGIFAASGVLLRYLAPTSQVKS